MIVEMLFPFRSRFLRFVRVEMGARSEREVKSLISRWREVKVDMKETAGGMVVRVDSWFESA